MSSILKFKKTEGLLDRVSDLATIIDRLPLDISDEEAEGLVGALPPDTARSVSAIFSGSSTLMGPQITYWVIYYLLVVAFTYFYTDVMIRNQNLPENLQKNGSSSPVSGPANAPPSSSTGWCGASR